MIITDAKIMTSVVQRSKSLKRLDLSFDDGMDVAIYKVGKNVIRIDLKREGLNE